MPKNNMEDKSVKTFSVTKFIFRTSVVCVLVAVGYGAWKYPVAIEKAKSLFVSEPEVDVYQPQLDVINGKINAMNSQLQFIEKKINASLSQIKAPDLSPLYDKIAMIEKMNVNVIDSKADVATVLGVVTRMDKAEHKLDKLSAVTDDSALVLTATMLVKDAAEKGNGFEYEAGVLTQILSDNPELKTYAVQVEKFAKNGVQSELNLVKSFDNIYAEILNEQKEDFNQNWKERLTNKFNEFVKIKKTNTEDAKFVADAGLEKIKSLVDNGQLYVAAEELDKLSNDVWTKNQKLQEWAMRVKSRKEFLNLINSITAKSLAAMKVKFLKNM